MAASEIFDWVPMDVCDLFFQLIGGADEGSAEAFLPEWSLSVVELIEEKGVTVQDPFHELADSLVLELFEDHVDMGGHEAVS